MTNQPDTPTETPAASARAATALGAAIVFIIGTTATLITPGSNDT